MFVGVGLFWMCVFGCGGHQFFSKSSTVCPESGERVFFGTTQLVSRLFLVVVSTRKEPEEFTLFLNEMMPCNIVIKKSWLLFFVILTSCNSIFFTFKSN